MKKIIIALLIAVTSMGAVNAQNYAANSKFDILYWQYTTYSNYAGYLFQMNNFTDRAGTVTIELVDIGITETFYVEANSYNAFQVGYVYVSAGNPYVGNMRVNVTFNAGWTSKLKVRTDPSWPAQ